LFTCVIADTLKEPHHRPDWPEIINRLKGGLDIVAKTGGFGPRAVTELF
jgi:hypothetical protein